MTRSFRLTRKAEVSLVDIARWMIERFGVRQADLYETELVARCDALARGDAVSRSCAILVDNKAELRYAWAGEHFVVFLERPTEILIVDFLHSRCDLPRHIAALGALNNDGSDEG